MSHKSQEFRIDPTRETDFLADILDMKSVSKKVPKNVLPIVSKINNHIVKQINEKSKKKKKVHIEPRVMQSVFKVDKPVIVDASELWS